MVALIGLALAFIVTLGSWAFAPHASETGPDAVARFAVGMWLYAHHVPLDIGTVSLGLVPLGLLIIPGVLTYAGGRQLARVVSPQSLADVTRAVIPYALVYGVLAAIVAGVVRSDVVEPAARTAFVAATLIALLGGGLGLLRASGQLHQATQAVPGSLRAVGAAATAGLATVVMVSAVLTTVAIAIGFPDAAEMYRSLDAGWAGAPVLVLLTMAFVPNLVLWTGAFTTGLGFPLGAEGVVSPRASTMARCRCSLRLRRCHRRVNPVFGPTSPWLRPCSVATPSPLLSIGGKALSRSSNSPYARPPQGRWLESDSASFAG